MIIYLTRANTSYPMQFFLEREGRPLLEEIQVLHYEDLSDMKALPVGTYIFSDLERLSAAKLKWLANWSQILEQLGARILNRPNVVLCRYELLEVLHAFGLNTFNVYRVGERPRRYPVFIRKINDHKGPCSELLRSETELNRCILELQEQGRKPEDLMIVEYLHTADEHGVFRQYSCFLIGDSFIPKHMLFSQNWVTKNQDLINDALLQEEVDFLEARPHPHERQIRHIFGIAGIDYGRIDYAVIDGKIQVWEINTNPTIAPKREQLRPERHASQERTSVRLCEAFSALNMAAMSGAAMGNQQRGDFA